VVAGNNTLTIARIFIGFIFASRHPSVWAALRVSIVNPARLCHVIEMDAVLVVSVLAFIASLLPLIGKALTAWLGRKSATEIKITVNDIDTVFTVKDLNAEQVRRILDSLAEADIKRKATSDQPEKG
jgi:hypothetical protein